MNQDEDIIKVIDQLSNRQTEITQNLVQNQQQFRNLARRVWRVQEDERKQIARELHDGVGQLLTALLNKLQHQKTQDPYHDHDEIVALAKQALADTREISRLMRPRILDDLGLVPALEWLTRVMSENSPIDISLNTRVNGELDSDTQTLIFRVIQEATANAVKHAQCDKIDINLIVTDSLLAIKVNDNGIGFDESQLKPESVFGLAAMRDRVAAFGGQIDIEPSPNGGTQIKVTLIGTRQV